MRLSLLAVVWLAAAAACSSGPTRVIYLPAPVPAEHPVAPEPVEELLPPVGITIVDTAGSRMLVSTNQAAYVAIFEIVPNGGVSLIYPTSPRQRQVAFAGSNSVAVRRMQAGVPQAGSDNQRRNARARDGSPVHYLYAIATARPLRLGDVAFDEDRLREALGARAYRAIEPYETMEALARHFVPAQLDEDWGEDVFAIDRMRQRERVRYATVYCPDGRVIRVRDELADRTSCPAVGRGAGTMGRVSRPDSTVGSNGRRVATGAAVRRGPPLHRVERPRTNGNEGNAGNAGNDNGNNGSGGNAGNNSDNNDNNNGNNGNGNGRGEAPNPSTPWRRVQPQGNTRPSPHDATSTAKPEPMPATTPAATPAAKPDSTVKRDSTAAAKPRPEVTPDSVPAAKPAPARKGGAVWQRAAKAKADSVAADSARAGKP